MHFPENLVLLHAHDEALRAEALRRIGELPNVALHFNIVEAVMDILDVYRQQQSGDEDQQTLQSLGCRVFNAFASATTLMLAGYYQPSAMLLRDVLETAFLINYFGSEPAAIARWRASPKGKAAEEFKPVKIREYLDKRDGFVEQKRKATYQMFSELAGHPTALSLAMLRPVGMDIRNGPFLDMTTLEAVASEMGKLAVQIGEAYAHLLAAAGHTSETQSIFWELRRKWLVTMGFIVAQSED